jgi:putative PEP-CTERM system TPR-repeat lipoprotein
MTKRSSLLSAAMIAVCLSACQSDPGVSKQRFLESGDAFSAAGKYAEAAIEYRNALEKDPRAGDVRAKLGDALLQNGDFANASAEYVRAADLRRDDDALQLKAGQLLLLGGRFDDAKARAETVLEKDASDVEAQILVAQALAGLKDLDGAVAQIEDALRVDPDRSGTYSSLGQLELSRGRRDAAQQAFVRAVELQPDSAAAHLALGTFYWLTGQVSAAEQSLTRALQHDPRGALTNRALASFYVATNRPSDAEQPLRTAYEVTKTPASAMALVDYYIAVGNDAAATTIVQGLLHDARWSAPANVRLAAIDYKAGRHEDAHRRLDTVLAADRANLGALLEKSGLLLAEGKPEQALVNAGAAARYHATSTAALFMLGRVQAARREPDAAIAAFQEVVRLNPRATAAQVALAQLHLAQGHPAASIRVAQEALANEPANGEAQLMIVRGLLQRGEREPARAALKPLMTRFPDSAAVHTLMGMLLTHEKQIAAARSEFERALQLQPGVLEAVGGLVALDLAARDHASARARLDPLVASSPTAPLLTLAARTYAAGGDLSSAERFLRRAIDLDSTYLAAYAVLGRLYGVQGKLAAARKEFEALLARSPRSVAALTMIGILFQSEGDLNAARDRFEQALEIDPDAAVAANNLAWIFAENSANLDRALLLAQRARRRLPDVSEVGDTLGFVYYKKGLTAQAISTLKPIAEKDPGNAVYRYHLGLAYAGAGDSALAKQSLTQALALKSDFQGAREAKDLLGSLGAR